MNSEMTARGLRRRDFLKCALAACGAMVAAGAVADKNASAPSALPSFEIVWDKPYSMGPGGYARIHRLSDGRYMLAYALGRDMVARFSAKDAPVEWSKPQIAARHFIATGGVESGPVSLANAEFAQLAGGRIIYACYIRPGNPKAHPYAIAIATSDDGGKNWSPLKTIYRAEAPGHPEAPVHGCGCWEPFVLPLEGGRAQIYFADESPYYRPGVADCQNISCIETADNGETWSGPVVASCTPERRDGMPVVMDMGKKRYLAIEANPGKTFLHPQIVMCDAEGGWQSAVRFEPLASPPDWNKTYGGAPYIAQTRNYVLLSWQESMPAEGGAAAPVARVAAAPKNETAPGGRFGAMRAVSTPPGIAPGKNRMLWNSLCPVGGDRFLLVSETNGIIVIHPGEIKAK